MARRALFVSSLLLAAATFTLDEARALACGGWCDAVCWYGCNGGYHYSWQQGLCVDDNNIASGWCDDGYACYYGHCGGAGERYCNTAGTGCNSCFDGYYTDGGGINQYGSFNIDGTVFCPATVRCQPGCERDITIPNINDVTFYATGEMEFGRTGPNVEAHHIKHVRLLNRDYKWPARTSTPDQPVDSPVAVVMAGDMAYTDQGEASTVAMCDRLTALRRYYDHDRFNRLPDRIRYPVFPGLGNHDSVKPGWGASYANYTDYDQNYIMTNYMDIRLTDGAGHLCMGVENYDGGRNGRFVSGFKSHNYSWDWAGYHLIQGNAWAGQLTGGDLSWLEDDLETYVGSSGRPVIYIQHYGYVSWNSIGELSYWSRHPGEYWWTPDDRERLFAILDRYNVAALIHGHDDPETGLRGTVAHGDRTYPVLTIPRAGKSPDGPTRQDSGGFLASRLRPSVADFAFYNYPTGDGAIASPEPSSTYVFRNAEYNGSLGAPVCGAVSSSCLSRTLRGRLGSELDAPNTISAARVADEACSSSPCTSVEQIRVTSIDGGLLRAGVQAKVEVTVQSWPIGGFLDIWISPNVTNPVWTPIGLSIPVMEPNLRTISLPFTVPANTPIAVVRARFRDFSSGGSGDTDDLAFAVYAYP